MNQSRTKRNMFLIATSIFLVTMSTVFFLAGEDKISVETEDIQAFVLHDNQIESINNEEEYRDLLQNQEENFAIVNPDRTFKFLSASLENTHGYSLNETEDMNVLTFIHPKDLPTFGNSLIEYNQDLETKSNIGPIRMKTKSGKYIPYMVSLIPIKNDEGEKAATAVILKDISTPLGEQNAAATVPDEESDIITELEEIADDENVIEDEDEVVIESGDIEENEEVVEDENIDENKEIVEDEDIDENKEIVEDENIDENEEIVEDENIDENEEIAEDEDYTDIKTIDNNDEKIFDNNGHGNNKDGFDSDNNPGKKTEHKPTDTHK